MTRKIKMRIARLLTLALLLPLMVALCSIAAAGIDYEYTFSYNDIDHLWSGTGSPAIQNGKLLAGDSIRLKASPGVSIDFTIHYQIQDNSSESLQSYLPTPLPQHFSGDQAHSHLIIANIGAGFPHTFKGWTVVSGPSISGASDSAFNVSFTLQADYDVVQQPVPTPAPDPVSKTPSVYLDGNGGSWLSTANWRVLEAREDGTVALSNMSLPEREGYVLSGWNTAADGSGKTWDFATDIATETLTLYAQWADVDAVTPPQTGAAASVLPLAMLLLGAAGLRRRKRR